MKAITRLKKIACACAVLVLVSLSAPVYAQDSGLPSELADLEGAEFLSGLTDAAAANPAEAGALAAAALQHRLSSIEETPGLARSIVLAVIAGLPEEMRTPESVSAIINASVGVLRNLPVHLSHVASELGDQVLEGMPEDFVADTRGLISQGPQGSLRNSSAYIFSVPPTGGMERSSGSVTICHKGKNTITVSENALAAHLGHGDTVGPCEVTPER